MGKAITAVDRRGKNILISLMGDYLLLIHQKISGRLMVGNWERRPENEAGGTPISAKIRNRPVASSFGLVRRVMRQSGSIVR